MKLEINRRNYFQEIEPFMRLRTDVVSGSNDKLILDQEGNITIIRPEDTQELLDMIDLQLNRIREKYEL